MKTIGITLLLLFLSAPAWAQQNCRLQAETPQLNPTVRTISGSGSRGFSCNSSVRVTVKLKKDRRFWFDKTLVTRSQVGANVEIPVLYNCQGNGHQKVYIEVEGGGSKVQSSRRSVSFCS